MRKFVDGELNSLEFAQEFLDRLLADKEKANSLLDDFCFSLLVTKNSISYQKYSVAFLNYLFLLVLDD